MLRHKGYIGQRGFRDEKKMSSGEIAWNRTRARTSPPRTRSSKQGSKGVSGCSETDSRQAQDLRVSADMSIKDRKRFQMRSSRKEVEGFEAGELISLLQNRQVTSLSIRIARQIITRCGPFSASDRATLGCNPTRGGSTITVA